MALDRRQLESILRVNSVDKSSSDDQIRKVLSDANLNNEEIDSALMTLKEDPKMDDVGKTGLHKVFRTDQCLKSSEISYLLGIDVSVEKITVASRKAEGYSIWRLFFLGLLSITLAAVVILVYMYFHQMGLFHPTSGVDMVFYK